jgi:MFS transporter, FHS family, glucose/mannose:H+ symporter
VPHRARDWTSGFTVLGVFAGILGSLLVAWQYHIDVDPEIIGLHFLGLNAGYVAGAATSQRLLRRFPIRWTAVASCLLGCAALLGLALVPPPWPAEYRISGLALLGLATGGLGAALLHVLEPYFRYSPAWSMNIAGAMFGLGCAVATCTVAATYFVFTSLIARAALAGIPFAFAVLFAKSRFPAARVAFPVRPEDEKSRRALGDLRSIAAVLFSLLLFFQSGNEWVIAGWLPVFLIRRLGTNPIWAILALAIYFIALTTGRLVGRRLFPAVSHRRLLLGGTALAMAGYLLLGLTSSMALAWVAVITMGAGFAPIYPLLAETLDDRFSYHPGFYNGLFTIAITGAMCVPWLIGYVDRFWGIQYLMLVPAFGSIVVSGLTLALMFEAKLMGRREQEQQDPPPKAAAAAAGAGKR